MRIDSASSAISTIKTQSTENDRVVNRNLKVEKQLGLEREASSQAQKKIFQTIDPESGELTTIGEKKLIEAIEKANKSLQGVKTSFEFSIHEATKEIMVKVINTETNEVIREIPPEKILDIVAKIWELTGIMVDEKI